MKSFSIKYTLLTYRLDQLWFPLAFWALFVIIILLVGSPHQNLEIVRGYMGVAVPLIGGVMAAYAILDDPALELRFATPIRMAQILFERTIFIFLIQTICVLLFLMLAQLLQIDLSPLGSWVEIHLAWSIPTMTFIALGTLGSILGAQTMMGAFLVGIVWIIQLVIRDGMAINHWKYFYIFMGILNPEHPDLHSNQMALLGLSLIFLLLSWSLLHRQERYI
jgi:hypothetical protein